MTGGISAIFLVPVHKDRHYNTPRTWFAQRYLSPNASLGQRPEDSEMPFIRKAEFKIANEGIQYVLKSHFNETPYDPMGMLLNARLTELSLYHGLLNHIFYKCAI